MPRDPQEILALFREREAAQGPLLSRMRDLKMAYEGDIVLPLPELGRTQDPAVPNLIMTGLDQTAMRISSVMPDVTFPSSSPGVRNAEKASRTKRQVSLGWWEMSMMRLLMRQRARWLIGYASSPVFIRPDLVRGVPEWVVRDPLCTYPAPPAQKIDMTPTDCIFVSGMRLADLQRRYPQQADRIYKGPEPRPDDVFKVLEFIDGDEWTTVVAGVDKQSEFERGVGTTPAELLATTVNRTGQCLAVVPRGIGIDRPLGQYDGLIGIYQQQAKLVALEAIAIERAIFPEVWFLGQNSMEPSVVSIADPRVGQVGILKDAQIEVIRPDPSFSGLNFANYLERSQRVSGGIPAEFGGESASNVRTGRRGDAILSAVVDFTVQEAQEIFAHSLREENRRAVAVAKSWFPNTKSFYVGWSKARGKVDYDPTSLFDTDENYVSYAHAGADINSLIIGLGQRVGTGMLSKQGAMELDPLVDDPETEHDRVISEALETALLQSVQAQAADPTGPYQPRDIARLMELVRTNRMELAEAIQKVNEEAQERQATQAPPGSPETQPGLSPPGVGAEQPTAIPEPEPSVQNLANILGGLRRGQMQLNVERQPVQ